MKEAQRAFAATTESLAELGDFLLESCGDDENRMLIELAVTEVVVNAIRHGGAELYELRVACHDEGWRIEIVDDGRAFNVLEAEAQPLGELREGGYGLGILRAAATELDYARHNDRNHLTLHFSKGGRG